MLLTVYGFSRWPLGDLVPALICSPTRFLRQGLLIMDGRGSFQHDNGQHDPQDDQTSQSDSQGHTTFRVLKGAGEGADITAKHLQVYSSPFGMMWSYRFAWNVTVIAKASIRTAHFPRLPTEVEKQEDKWSSSANFLKTKITKANSLARVL